MPPCHRDKMIYLTDLEIVDIYNAQINKIKNLKGKSKWRAVYIERCTHGSERGLCKPIKEI